MNNWKLAIGALGGKLRNVAMDDDYLKSRTLDQLLEEHSMEELLSRYTHQQLFAKAVEEPPGGWEERSKKRVPERMDTATLEEAKAYALPHPDTVHEQIDRKKYKARLEKDIQRARASQGPILPENLQATESQGRALRAIMAKRYPGKPLIGIDETRLSRQIASNIIDVLDGGHLPPWEELRDYIIEVGAYRVPTLRHR